MEKRYNELAEKQRYYYDKISNMFVEFDKLPPDDNARQTFYQGNFGLTNEEVKDMKRTKKEVEKVLLELKANGINPTAEQLINGFEVI